MPLPLVTLTLFLTHAYTWWCFGCVTARPRCRRTFMIAVSGTTAQRSRLHPAPRRDWVHAHSVCGLGRCPVLEDWRPGGCGGRVASGIGRAGTPSERVSPSLPADAVDRSADGGAEHHGSL